MITQLQIPFRQIHLDFHTSPLIPDVGKEFDAKKFVETLQGAHVTSVTCFARCHHGHLYFESSLHPERIHPHLVRRHLLREMVEACRAASIRVPIYTSVQWDRFSWDHNPEWRLLAADGTGMGFFPLEPGFYGSLNIGHAGYVAFLRDHVSDVIGYLGGVDGMFFDIVWPHHAEDCSEKSLQAMKALGLDPLLAGDRTTFGRMVTAEFVEGMTSHVHGLCPEATVYYNNTNLAPNHRQQIGAFTHLEFDALPGDNPEGYHQLPIRARFERNLLPCVAQTGRFHTGWADFHSYKNEAALEFECFHALALNVRCLIGDQMHPTGTLDTEAYRRIGSVYKTVQKVEPWCEGAVPLVEIGLLFTTAEETHAAARLLQEEHLQFDVIDRKSDFTRYKVLLLTDSAVFDNELAARVAQAAAAGVGILASYGAGMDIGHLRFVDERWQLTMKDAGDPTPVLDERNARAEFVRTRSFPEASLPSLEHVMYLPGYDVQAGPGWKVLADRIAPYFSRNYEHYCSHRQAPSSGRIIGPAVLERPGFVYFAHPVFRIANELSPLWVKKLVGGALRRLLGTPLLRTNGPSSLITTLQHQPSQSRRIIHLLHYIPERRAKRLEVIEERARLTGIEVDVIAPRKVRSVKLVLEGLEVPFRWNEGRAFFTVPQIDGYQVVSVDYE